MKIRILGCSGGIGGDLRTTSLLIDDDILIDAGTGISNLTLEEMAKIRHIFITHTHLDHIACLPLMVDSIFDKIDSPIIIHGQPLSIDALKNNIFNWAIWPNFAELPTMDAPVIRYAPLEPGEKRLVGDRSFEMIPVNHIVPTVAYRIETGPLSTRIGDRRIPPHIRSTVGGIAAPWLFGLLIGTGSRESVFYGYALGAALMILAAAVELMIGVKAERVSLEGVARPLAAEDPERAS